MTPPATPEERRDKEERARQADADFVRATRVYYETMGLIVAIAALGWFLYEFIFGSL